MLVLNGMLYSSLSLISVFYVSFTTSSFFNALAIVCTHCVDSDMGFISIRVGTKIATLACCGACDCCRRIGQCDGRYILATLSDCSGFSAFFAALWIYPFACLGVVMSLALNSIDLSHECMA
jgi:hypothetical protein